MSEAAAAPAAPPGKSGTRVAVQKFGTFLSGMIMPNIAAFIAWGIITALFIEKGRFPLGPIGGCGARRPRASPYAGLVGPMIRYMLPILIAAQGGRMVYGVRGAVVGCGRHHGRDHGDAAADVPRRDDHGPAGRVADEEGRRDLGRQDQARLRDAGQQLLRRHPRRPAWPLRPLYIFGPVIEGISTALGNGVNWLIEHSLLPLASIIIEPAKVLFLNNAINHGVLTPLGIKQSAEEGQSILFLLEANPGPGLGVLLAYSIFGTGLAKSTAPAAAIIQFFGGIHEIYFPYVLMKPILLLGHDRRRHGRHLHADDLRRRPAGARPRPDRSSRC